MRRDLAAQPVDVDLDREQRVRVAGLLRLEHRAHVGRPGEPEQPRAMLERGGELRRRHADVLLEPDDEPRIDGARASPHHEPFQRRKTHRRVDELRVDRAQRTRRPDGS